MPVDIYNLTEGWLELESDPGLFTLLLEDFGVKGVQVEEIYDLQKSLEGPVYGFIFLFRWIEERRSRRKIVDQSESFVKDEDIVNNIFFAQQMVPNSCATHALLSVLLNCPNIHLGNTLSRLKAHTSGMNPENKGWAIGNTPELAKAHNSHAMPQAKRRLDKSSGVTTGRFTGEAFHFVSYVPINGKLFELDGLKPFPMDHGPFGEKEDWTEKFRRVIIDRLGIATGEQYDIRFNLMAVVPDTRLALTHKLKMLKTNRQIVLEALQQLIKLSHQEIANNKGERISDLNDLHLSNTNNESASKSEKIITNGNYQIALKSGKNSISSEPLKNTSLDGFDYLNSPVILETHNYKLLHSTSDSSKLNVNSLSNEENYILFKNDSDKIKTLNTLDYSTPLTIQTSPAPSSSSTDTSSEVGSAFNSPTQGLGWNSGQSSPLSTKDFKKFVVIRVAGTNEDKVESSPTAVRALNSTSKRTMSDIAFPNKKICLDTNSKIWTKDFEKSSNLRDIKSYNKEDFNLNEEKQKINQKLCSKYPELFEPHTFAPKDLLALLKNLENEISHCEMNLRDENEKRKKYKIDDCRRTHNYDEFICTFLSMLAQQGKLADLVEQHLILHKKPGAPIRTQRSSKKNDSKSCTARRRKGKNKYKKRK